jgi:hypothetical protein
LDSNCLWRNNLIVMALRINNTSFKINNSSFRTISPLIAPPVGQVFRIVNTGGTTDSLTYTKIDGSTTSTGNITAGSITYILALFGSISDNSATGAGGQLTVTNLLITSSVDETPTFTEQVITTTGTGTFTKPVGVTQVIVECWGGGGAGGGVTDVNSAGGGGAGGQYARKLIIYGSAQQNISYTIGIGGGAGTGNGAAGGDTTWQSTIVVAKGGQPGLTSTTELPSGDFGEGSLVGAVGDVIYSGGSGLQGNYFARSGLSYGGGGGGGAGSSKNGNQNTTGQLYLPGTDSQEYGGTGGTGTELDTSGANGGNALIYAAGGSGASKISGANRTGGNGAQGLIRIIYR